MKNVHDIPRENISFFKRQSKSIISNKKSNLVNGQKDDEKKIKIAFEDDVKGSISVDSNEGSLVLMTCEEFEEQYPHITESQHDTSL